MRSEKPKIGDIYEIKLASGLAYVQYTHEAEDGTQLIRVLPGVYPQRPNSFSVLSQQKELYFVFSILVHGLRNNVLQLVSNEPIPAWAKPFPIMRKPSGRAKDGKITGWIIGHGLRLYTVQDIQRALHVRELSPEQQKLSIAQIWPASTLAKEVARGWSPDRSEQLEDADRRNAEERERHTQPTPEQIPRFIDHYLYFPHRRDADRAAQQLRVKGWTVEVKMGADRKNWLALAKQPAPIDDDIGDVRDELEDLADTLGGEYDGWGTAV